jgi:hypothetical protein
MDEITALDGPRYVVGLRDVKDPSLYKDTIQGDKEGEAKLKAEELAAKEGRATIVYDRKEQQIIYRVAAATETPKEPEVPKKRGKK